MTAVKVSVDTNPPPEESATTAAPGREGDGDGAGRARRSETAPRQWTPTTRNPGRPSSGTAFQPNARTQIPRRDAAAAPAPSASHEARETREAAETPEAPPPDDPLIEKARGGDAGLHRETSQ